MVMTFCSSKCYVTVQCSSIKAPCISHTTIIHHHALQQNTTQHYKINIRAPAQVNNCKSHATDRLIDLRNKVKDIDNN